MSVHLVLVRHGQSEWNVQHRMTGHTDVALTDMGRAQARQIAPHLAQLAVAQPFDTVWSSDLQRAVETATLALGPPRLDRRLREIDFGNWEGIAFPDLPADAVRALRDFTTFAAPAGESAAAMVARVCAFVDTLPSGHHAVFTHGGVIRALLQTVGAPQFVPNCAVVRIDWTERILQDLYAPDGLP